MSALISHKDARVSPPSQQAGQRKSGIELLKLLAMFLIVISHTVQTLRTTSSYVSFSDYVLPLGSATSDLQELLLNMFYYFGSLGNTIFFVCSAWFLLDRKQNNKKKLLQMAADVWVVSVSVLILVLILRRGKLSGSLILQALFPTLFSVNWYLTCYMLFYAIHPFLNQIIRKMSQRTLLRTAVGMFFLYSVCDLLHAFLAMFFEASSFFFISTLIVWVTIYFVLAYVHLYLPKKANSVRFNALLCGFGALALFGGIALFNLIGLRVPLFEHSLTIWNTTCNPFMLILVIGLFQLFRMAEFHAKAINYLSRLTLFIYIIHENLLIRRFYRPALWQYVYTQYGYSHVLLLTLLLAALIFLLSVLLSMLYYHSLHRLVMRLCDRAWPTAVRLVRSLENRIMRLK